MQEFATLKMDGYMKDYNEGAKRIFFFYSFTREYIKLASLIEFGTIGTEFTFFCFLCKTTNQETSPQ